MDLKLIKLDIANEPLARKNYLEKFKNKRKKMKNENSSASILCIIRLPFIGASHDGVILCECHAPQLIEIKYSLNHSGWSIENYSIQKLTA